MTYFRSVSGGRWEDALGEDGKFKAVLFADFRVDDDGISVWSGPVDVVAQIVASALERIGTIVLLEIPNAIVNDLGISVENSPGDSSHPKSNGRHRSIKCFSGPLLAALMDRLSTNPSLRRYGGVEVRRLLTQSIQSGLKLDNVRFRVVAELLKKESVTDDEAHPVLRRYIEDDPLCIAKLKPTQLKELIEACVVTREAATMIHPSCRTVRP